MTRVRPGQLYRRADDPDQRWVQIKIRRIVGDRAEVTDADGRYPRTVRLAALLWPSGLRLSGVREGQQDKEEDDG